MSHSKIRNGLKSSWKPMRPYKMLNRHLTNSSLKLHRLATQFLYKHAIKLDIPSNKTYIRCLCGQTYLSDNPTSNKPETYSFKPHLRLYSTQTDTHRQKVVIETSTPKILIEKVTRLEDKGLLRQDRVSKLAVWRNNLDPYVKLMRLDKPIGIWLLYWPCAWSIALGGVATGAPPSALAQTAGLFLAGAVLMRGAGCTVNDLWDRDIDARVERTKDRPLVTGAVSKRQAVGFLAAQLGGGLAVLLQLNWYSVALGASSLALVVTYPLAKRFTNYPQLFLGATFNWGALLGYSAVSGHLASEALFLYSAAAAWTVLYDTIYAHQDTIDDARIGIKSTALTFGSNSRPALAATAAVAAVLFAGAGHAAGLAWPYYAALAGAVAHAQRQIFTLQPDNPTDCAKKFKSNTWIGLIIFLGIVAGGYDTYLENRAKYAAKSLGESENCIAEF